VGGRRRHVQAGRGLPERHPTLNSPTKRKALLPFDEDM
jgi:hypothetical protein